MDFDKQLYERSCNVSNPDALKYLYSLTVSVYYVSCALFLAEMIKEKSPLVKANRKVVLTGLLLYIWMAYSHSG